MLQLRASLGLAKKSGPQGGIDRLRQKLEGRRPTEGQIGGQIHFAHSARSHASFHPIVGDGPTDQRGFREKIIPQFEVGIQTGHENRPSLEAPDFDWRGD